MWFFPINNCPGIPINYHPGAFGFQRRVNPHTGIDLYSTKDAPVFAVENGIIVNVEPFTGPKDDSPWWNDTDAVLIEGASGVVCYGEIQSNYLDIPTTVRRGDVIGFVKMVLREGKNRPDIPGHSRSMLHLELYAHGVALASTSWTQGRQILKMIDPTPHLIAAEGAPTNFLTWLPNA